MKSFWRLVLPSALTGAIALVPCSVRVAAQVAPPPSIRSALASEDSYRFRIGPVRFSPIVNLTNVGIDTNVFNDEEDPKRDFTATFGPGARLALSAGRARLRGLTSVDFVYFRTYEDQRSIGQAHELTLGFPLNRVTPYVGGAYRSQETRPNLEIDARVRRTHADRRLGAEVRLTGKATASLEARRESIDYEDAVYFGVDLKQALTEDVNHVTGAVRFALTPLTTFVVSATGRQDRFEFSTFRDADSFSLVPGFEFKPFALLKGKAFAGFRRFKTLSAAVPDYSGPVAQVDVAYTLHGTTRFEGRFDRDVTYSYEIADPFYLATGVAGSVAQGFGRRWEALGRAGRYVLDHRGIDPLGVDVHLEHRDVVTTLGAGIGCRLGRSVRVGFNVDYWRRRSDLSDRRDFNGIRAGGLFSLGS